MNKLSNFPIKNVLFILPIAIWIIAWTPTKFRPLKGAVTTAPDTAFSIKSWLSGDYQHAKESYLNDNFGGRDLSVRIHNQLDYSLYGKIHAKDVVEGKNGYLYEKGYIDSYCGRNFKAELSITNDFVDKATQVSSLLNAQGKNLILVIAPSKATIYPEFLPDKLACPPNAQTTYQYARKRFEEQSLNFIDFSSYFVEQKKVQPYPLFTPYGIHWSSYGCAIAFDSLCKYISVKRNITLPKLQISSVDNTYKCSEDSDCDLREGMNLLAPPQLPIKRAAPRIEWKKPGDAKLNVLFISDSFMWNWVQYYLPHNTFSYYNFWFYNNEYWDKNGKSGKVADLDIRTSIQEADVIVLVGTETHTADMSYGFINNALDALKNPAQ